MPRPPSRGQSKSADRPLPIFPLLLVALLLALVIYAVWVRLKLAKRPSETAEGPRSAAGSVLEPDRVIYGGEPRAQKSDARLNVMVLKNKAYTVGYSEMRRDPLWSAYHVVKREPPFVLPRPKGEFLTDTRVPRPVTHHDYTDSGFDRGHMTPNSVIAKCFGAEAQRETFLMTNICPQAPNLNREVWEKLEKDEIDWGWRFGEVWVMDGPIFPDVMDPSKGVKKLKSGVSLPEAFYKIVIRDPSGGRGVGLEVLAVIMPQDVKGTELPAQFTRRIRDIEERTGLEFLWKLPEGQRRQLEMMAHPLWGN